jgi:diguanylate cyclase (GGDEF)-like protein/PAS domain S-box-containing protein
MPSAGRIMPKDNTGDTRFIDLPAEEAHASEVSTAFTEAPIGMALLDVAGHFLQVNRVLCEMAGLTRTELLGRSFNDFVAPEDVDLDLVERQRLFADQIPSYRAEKRWHDAGGLASWVGISVSAARNRGHDVRYFVVSVEDITERRREEEQLQYLANRDPLTGLINRRRFLDDLTRQVTMSDRYGELSAVLLIDLDHFKPINDEYGHDAGDRVLQEVAATINERLRTTDLSARIGGDEFVVLVPHADAARLRVVAQALVDAIADRKVRYRDVTLEVTASIGVALLGPGSASNAHEVLARADAAMYEAKRAGGNRWSVSGGDTPGIRDSS